MGQHSGYRVGSGQLAGSLRAFFDVLNVRRVSSPFYSQPCAQDNSDVVVVEMRSSVPLTVRS